ncbi:hypothetical protein ACFYKX_05410 [Cytobacillus sp. FJAT-54145]|uniref:DUF3955 domain-containing protein n=1 Tax=Cytobacillus spartinae TaxID=3299023 RepID=A0ABW6K796_9BACI
MTKKYKFLTISFGLFLLSFLSWQVFGVFGESTKEMDSVTSYAIISFLGTTFFFLTTLILLIAAIFSRIRATNQ